MAPRGRAVVLVLGDIGRSPRMQFHALSLASQAGLKVDVIGYRGSVPHRRLTDDPLITLRLLDPPWSPNLPRALRLILLPLKVISQFISLMWMLCIRMPVPDYILVQNPPTIPTFTVVQFACWLRGAKMVIDWHNFGYTLLGLSLGTTHPFTRFYRWYERFFGRRAHAHLCVTRAMQHELDQNWNIRATVLYDRPPEFFRPATLEEKHQLFLKLNEALIKAEGANDWCADRLLEESGDSSREEAGIMQYTDAGWHVPTVENTLLTSRLLDPGEGAMGSSEENISLRQDRPAVIVSSTSWTMDEDFGVLLEAALMYDRRVAALLEGDSEVETAASALQLSGGSYPHLLFIITGKGPMRELYEEKIRRLRLRRVAFRTIWLAAEDYPILLGSADLGVSLHTSSSGLDLPMKVVDMFGCGLPVCAVGYSCIGELVKERENGLLFGSSVDLAGQLMVLFKGFPEACGELRRLRGGAQRSGSSSRWGEEWSASVLPLLTQLTSKGSDGGEESTMGEEVHQSSHI